MTPSSKLERSLKNAFRKYAWRHLSDKIQNFQKSSRNTSRKATHSLYSSSYSQALEIIQLQNNSYQLSR